MKKAKTGFVANVLKGVRHRLSLVSDRRKQQAGLTWFAEKKLKHLPYGRPGVFFLHGKRLEFKNGPELLHSLIEIFVDDIYKLALQKDAPLILDCGANIGLSVIYMKRQFPNARVIAFEPDPSNFSYLSKNISAFALADVRLENKAVWKETTTMKFVDEGTLSSKLSATGEAANTVDVQAVRLYDFLDQEVDFLKIDIEGAEYEVLVDCKDRLSNVTCLFIEYHGSFEKMSQLTEILTIVQNAGFVYYIKEASNVYATPFSRSREVPPYDIQQNIFCFKIR